jgi:hypothetical protein
MATPLENLAERLEKDPFFIACPLRLFATALELEDTQLAQRLGCSPDQLTPLRLCRAPQAEEGFQQDIGRVAAHVHADATALAEAVRMGQALYRMRENADGRTLVAARDAEDGVPETDT